MMAVRGRRITRRATLSELVAVGLAGLTRRTDAAPPPLVFGVVIPSASGRFYKRLLQGMQEEAPSLGVELRIQEYLFDPKNEVAIIDKFTSTKVDGLLIVPLGLSDVVAKAAVQNTEKAGIPVAAVVWRIPGASITVLPDLAKAGALQAQIAMSLARRSGSSKATFLYIAGPPAYFDPAVVSSFKKALASGDFNVIVVTPEVFVRDATVGVAAQALAAHPEVSIIVSSNDELAEWGVEAAAKVNRPIISIGLGGSEEDLPKTRLTATVDLRPDIQGKDATRKLNSLIRNPKKVCDNNQNPPCPEELVEPQSIIANK